jgi:hypothetical protein
MPDENSIKKFISRDGKALKHYNPYVFWVGGENATLDGSFSAAELRAVADFMDSHKGGGDA